MVSFQIKLTAVAVCSLIAFLMPLALKWNMKHLVDKNSAPILIALQSNEFQTSLVVSLSISAPMFFELLLRIILNAKPEFVFPNAVIFATLALPDLVILTYVRETLDLSSLNYILKARLVLLAWIAYSFIRIHGGNKCSGVLSSFVLVCIGSGLDLYKVYFDQSFSNVITLIAIISDVAGYSILVIVSLKWYYFILLQSKSPTSFDQYMCTIYITAILFTGSGLLLTLLAFPGSLDWFNWNSDVLTVHTLTYTVFYVMVIVFEGRALQREMLQTKVTIFIFLLLFHTFTYYLVMN